MIQKFDNEIGKFRKRKKVFTDGTGPVCDLFSKIGYHFSRTYLNQLKITQNYFCS